MGLLNRLFQSVTGVTFVNPNFAHLYGHTWAKAAVAKSQKNVEELIRKNDLLQQLKFSGMAHGDDPFDKLSYFENGKERWFIQPVYNKTEQCLDIRLVDYRGIPAPTNLKEPTGRPKISMPASFSLGTPTDVITKELTDILLENLGKDYTRKLVASRLINDAEFAPNQQG